MTETTDHPSKLHAIDLYNKIHGIGYAQTPDFAKAARDEEVKVIAKALRVYAVGATGNA